MMDSRIRIRLGRAHATMAVMTVVLAAVALLLPSGTSSAPKPTLETAAYLLRGTALAYLLLTALALWLRWRGLEQLDRAPPPPNLLALLGHFWVLWVAGAAAVRGMASRTLLAGCDPVLAALVTAGALCLALQVADWWQQRRSGDPLVSETSRLARRTWPDWLSGLAAWLVVLALWYIETRPLP